MKDPAPEPGKQYHGMQKRAYFQMFPPDGKCYLQIEGKLVIGEVKAVTDDGFLYIKNTSKHIPKVAHVNYFMVLPRWVFNETTIMEFLN